MIANLKFSKMTGSIGRNGFIKTSGIALLKTDANHDNPACSIAPLTSRGKVGNCCIELPMESLPAIITRLQQIHTKHVATTKGY